MDITSAVARNCKVIREQKKLTLDAASALTGVSRSMLAQIEKGDVNPTISVLWKIAVGYKVSFSSLVEEGGTGIRVVRGQDVAPLTEDDGRYRIRPIFPFDDEKLFEIYTVSIAESGALAARPHMKGAEEYITVFSGDVEITVDTERHLLHPGDSIHFPADVPHGYKNAGTGEAAMHMLIYYNK